MDFAVDERVELVRAEARQMVRDHLTPEVLARVAATGGSRHDWEFHREMTRRGWLLPCWRPEDGGLGWARALQDVLHEEMVAAGAPVMGAALTRIICETLARVGTEEQKERIIGPALAGELIAALGYTEPEAGSDLASVRTRATKVEGGWIIDGQKIFTTISDLATYVWLLARTDTSAPKHSGLSMFLVPTDSPGFAVTPIATLSGERTNVSYYTDVFVDDTALVGQPGEGWEIVNLALAFERGGEFAGLMRRLVDDTAHHHLAAGLETRTAVEPRVARRLGWAHAEAEVSRLLGSNVAQQRRGADGGYVAGAMAKVYATEALQRAADALLNTTGPLGLWNLGEPAAAADGEIQQMYRESQIATIYGGSSEVLKGVIARGRLGLPRGAG